MLTNTRRPIHIGVNFLLTPTIVLDTKRQIDFQRRLMDGGIEVAQTNRTDRELNFFSPPSEPFQVRVILNAPQVAQILMVSPTPIGDLDVFARKAEIICSAFKAVWPEPQQSVSRDATLRHLYQSKGDDSFKFIWEKRLRQKPDDFSELGRPVLGGGLRFVLPRTPDHPSQIEVRVESYMKDSRMLFVETQQVWPFPLSVEEALQPRSLLDETQTFATTNLVRFISCGMNSDEE